MNYFDYELLERYLNLFGFDLDNESDSETNEENKTALEKNGVS